MYVSRDRGCAGIIIAKRKCLLKCGIWYDTVPDEKFCLMKMSLKEARLSYMTFIGVVFDR